MSEQKQYLFMGSRVTFKLDERETDNSIAILEQLERKGGEPPFHKHNHEDEVIEVKSGEITFFLDDQVIDSQPGDIIFIPKGHPHRFELKTDYAEIQTITTPANYAAFVKEVGRPVEYEDENPTMPNEEDINRLIKIGKNYDMEFLINGQWV